MRLAFLTNITVATINNNKTTAKWKRTTKTALTAAAERIIVRKIPALEILRQSKNINDALIGFASHSKCMSVHKIDPYVWKIVNKQRQTKFIAKRPQNENGTARRERENSSTVDLFDCCKKNRLLDAKVSKDTVYAKPLQYEMSAVVVVCIVSSQSNIKHNSNNKQKKKEGMKETQKIII